MKKIVLTYHSFIEGEVECIKDLIQSGLYAVHIRKPQATYDQLENFICQFNSYERSFFVMCTHRSLVDKYALKGMHYSSKENLPTQRADWYTYSTSCHTLEEVKSISNEVDYVFLSPIFDSISKPGYTCSWDNKDQISQVLGSHKGADVIALGGVCDDNIEEIKSLHFDGYAMLGAVWMPLINKEESIG